MRLGSEPSSGCSCAASAWRRRARSRRRSPGCCTASTGLGLPSSRSGWSQARFGARSGFSAFLWFAAGWLIFVYVPIAHWVWGGGFLASAGALDFAGGTVVQLNAGIAGLIAAYVLGKRHGYRSENFAPHDLSLAVIG